VALVVAPSPSLPDCTGRGCLRFPRQSPQSAPAGFCSTRCGTNPCSGRTRRRDASRAQEVGRWSDPRSTSDGAADRCGSRRTASADWLSAAFPRRTASEQRASDAGLRPRQSRQTRGPAFPPRPAGDASGRSCNVLARLRSCRSLRLAWTLLAHHRRTACPPHHRPRGRGPAKATSSRPLRVRTRTPCSTGGHERPLLGFPPHLGGRSSTGPSARLGFPTAAAVRRCRRLAPSPGASLVRAVAGDTQLPRLADPGRGQRPPNWRSSRLAATAGSPCVLVVPKAAGRRPGGLQFRWTLHRPERARPASPPGRAVPCVPERDAASPRRRGPGTEPAGAGCGLKGPKLNASARKRAP
jgi:hypothetical protein